MENKNKKQKLERPTVSYYQKRKRSLQTKRTVRKYLAIIIFPFMIPVMAINYAEKLTLQGLENDLGQTATTSIMELYRDRTEAYRAQNEEIKLENEKLNQYDDILSSLGTMGEEIKLAGIEFGDTIDEQVKLIGLSIGIANAESTLGKNFAIEYDMNCHNWWGMKGGNMTKRTDGSSLRCFDDKKAGARTFASLMKRLYLDMGLDTPEKIVNKYVGSKWTVYHTTWVDNVNKFYDRQ